MVPYASSAGLNRCRWREVSFPWSLRSRTAVNTLIIMDVCTVGPLSSIRAVSLILTLSYFPLASAQQGSPSATSGGTDAASHHASLPLGIRNVLDMLDGVPAELHSNALLLLVESNQKLDKSTKIKFLLEAFEEAPRASNPVKMSRGTPQLDAGSDAAMKWFAYEQNLDRVSLASRSIIDMATIDPDDARSLATRLRLPEMPAVGCAQALVYDPKPYYSALAAVAHGWKANSADSNLSIIDLLAPAVGSLETHTQVPLAAGLISGAGLSTDDLEMLAGLFAGQLRRLREDERGFSAEMDGGNPTKSVNRLYKLLETTDPGSGSGLLKEFRTYLVENYRMGGCGDLWLPPEVASSGGGATNQSARILPAAIIQFNDTFRAALDRAGLGQIRLEEIDRSVPAASLQIHHYWSDPESASLLRAAQLLRFDKNEEKRSESSLASTEWQQQAITFLGNVDDWRADPSKSVEVFNEKSVLYQSPIDLAPQSEIKWLAIEKFLSMIENSGLEREDAPAWMFLASQVQERAFSLGTNGAKEPASAKLTKRFVNSSSPSLRLVGALDALHIDPFSSGPLEKLGLGPNPTRD